MVAVTLLVRRLAFAGSHSRRCDPACQGIPGRSALCPLIPRTRRYADAGNCDSLQASAPAGLPGSDRLLVGLGAEHVHPREAHQIYVEEVAGHERGGVGMQERAPRVDGGALQEGRWDPLRAQDLADRCGSHTMTETAQLALEDI